MEKLAAKNSLLFCYKFQVAVEKLSSVGLVWEGFHKKIFKFRKGNFND